MGAQTYLASLPEVETARLPRGTLFVADGLIYQVTDTGGGGFSKARQWRRDEKTEVALIPNSIPAKYLPVVKRGRLLPVYRSRSELTVDGQPRSFLFPTEVFALDAAYLDVALILSPGAYVRNHSHEPAFAVTDGVHIFRLYYYSVSAHGLATTIGPAEYPRAEMRPYQEGSPYWQLLPGWRDLPREVERDPDVTRPSTPVRRDLAKAVSSAVHAATAALKTQESAGIHHTKPGFVSEPPLGSEDTIPHRSL